MAHEDVKAEIGKSDRGCVVVALDECADIGGTISYVCKCSHWSSLDHSLKS